MNKGNVYLIKLSNNRECFYKIGITVHRFCRFYEIMKAGYRIKIIYMIHGIEYLDALKAENNLHQIFEPYTPINKFGGYRECYSHVNINAFKKQIHALVKSYSEITENLEISWR